MPETKETGTKDQNVEKEKAIAKKRHFELEVLLRTGLTVDALRSKDNPIVAAVEKGSAKMAKLIVTERPDEVVEKTVAPTSSESSLSEVDTRKLHDLFESREAGYKGYALQMLKHAKIDPDNLPKGSAPLWESAEAALSELSAKLTPAVFEKITKDMTTPAIVVEPIINHQAVYVKNEEDKYDYRVVGDTLFYVFKGSAKDLDKANQLNNVSPTDGQRIVAWRIGIADKAEVPKTLKSDGDVHTKKLEDRAKDFHSEGGHGALGFVSVIDHPVLYGLMMNESRNRDKVKPIDDYQKSNGGWTMGTRVDNSGQDSYVAGGFWNDSNRWANLINHIANRPFFSGHVRLAVMFNKS